MKGGKTSGTGGLSEQRWWNWKSRVAKVAYIGKKSAEE